MTPKEVLALCRQKEIRAVDLRFMDFPGTQKHFTIPVKALTEESFEDGFGFDGSSIRGWQAINESDMLVVPLPETAMVDPFMKSTLALTCNIQDPITREDYPKDPRNVARKAEAYMQSTGIADTANFGPEAEFFVFDDVRFDQNEHEAYYHLDSGRRAVEPRPTPTSAASPATSGYRIRHREGYFPMPPADTLQDLRTEIMLTLQECGVEVEGQHHEVATGGQCEIDMKYGPLVSRRPTTCCATSTSSRTSPPGTARRRRSCPSRCGTTTARGCTCISRCGRGQARCSPVPVTAG